MKTSWSRTIVKSCAVANLLTLVVFKMHTMGSSKHPDTMGCLAITLPLSVVMRLVATNLQLRHLPKLATALSCKHDGCTRRRSCR